MTDTHRALMTVSTMNDMGHDVFFSKSDRGIKTYAYHEDDDYYQTRILTKLSDVLVLRCSERLVVQSSVWDLDFRQGDIYMQNRVSLLSLRIRSCCWEKGGLSCFPDGLLSVFLIWSIAMSAVFPLGVGLPDLRSLSFLFLEEFCSNDHLDNFKRESLAVDDLYSLPVTSPDFENMHGLLHLEHVPSARLTDFVSDSPECQWSWNATFDDLSAPFR